MKYLLDTANLDDIRRCCAIFPIAGVTSNPSIVKREGNVDFFAHMREIRSIIGMDSPLHIQVTAPDAEGMVRDADAIMEKVDSNVFVKVPVTLEGPEGHEDHESKGHPHHRYCSIQQTAGLPGYGGRRRLYRSLF